MDKSALTKDDCRMSTRSRSRRSTTNTEDLAISKTQNFVNKEKRKTRNVEEPNVASAERFNSFNADESDLQLNLHKNSTQQQIKYNNIDEAQSPYQKISSKKEKLGQSKKQTTKKTVISPSEQDRSTLTKKSGKSKKKSDKLIENIQENDSVSSPEKVDLNASFVISENPDRRAKQRRLSGRFKTSSKQFLENDSSEEEKENLLTPQISTERSVINSKSVSKRQNLKPATEEDICKLYTSKILKRQHRNLETVFETTTSSKMSVRKYKRFINFDERFNQSKTRKRQNKVRKYELRSSVKE